jgi:hypothetical protein
MDKKITANAERSLVTVVLSTMSLFMFLGLLVFTR